MACDERRSVPPSNDASASGFSGGGFGVDGSRDCKVVGVELFDELLFVYRSVLRALNLSNLCPLSGRDFYH